MEFEEVNTKEKKKGKKA